jgi:hypothetical protein
MKVTIKKKTDQLNYEDFLGGVTRTFTIAGYRELSGEQNYEISLAEDTRYWRPPTTDMKKMVALWGDESDVWVGRRVTLAGDPEVMMAGQKVGGIRLTHMSDIGPKPVSMSLTVTRGKKRTFTVQPLPDAPAPDPRIEQLKAEWREATPERRAEIEAEVKRLGGGA